MAAHREFPDELRERATRRAVDARQAPTTRSSAIPRPKPSRGNHSPLRGRCQTE
jgi:transposase